MVSRKSYYRLYKYSLISLLIIIILVIVYKFYFNTSLVEISYNVFTFIILIFRMLIATHVLLTLGILLIYIISFFIPKNKFIKKLRKQSYLIIPKSKIKEYASLLGVSTVIFILVIYFI